MFTLRGSRLSVTETLLSRARWFTFFDTGDGMKVLASKGNRKADSDRLSSLSQIGRSLLVSESCMLGLGVKIHAV